MRIKVLLLLLLSSFYTNAQNINFPDPVFKQNLLLLTSNGTYIATGEDDNYLEIDANGDGEIQISEAQAVYTLSLTLSMWSEGPFITNLTGIEYFTNLRRINIAYHHIPVINVTALSNLKEIACINSSLVSLDISGLSNLERLVIGHCPISQLSFSGNTSLRTLEINSTQIENLDLSSLPNLEYVICPSNSFNNLNVSGLINLTYLNCEENNISTLNLSGLTALETVVCKQNQITNIDISDTPSLMSLEAANNSIENINFFPGNIITTINVAENNISDIDVSSCRNLTSLSIGGNNLTSIDVSHNTELLSLQAPNNDLIYVNLKNGPTPSGGNPFSLGLAGNDNLRYVCIDEDEDYTVFYYFSGNHPNCLVNTYCSFGPGGAAYRLQGMTGFETAVPCLDNALPLQTVTISDGTVSGIFMSDSSGSYSIPAMQGTYTLTPINPNPVCFTVTPESVTVNFPAGSETFTQNFCLQSTATVSDAEIVIVPVVPARPGFDATYRLIYSNKGNTTLGGTITLTFFEDLMDFVSAGEVPASITPGQLVWNYSALQPFETRYIDFVMNVNSPMEIPAVNIDDVLGFVALIDPVPGDGTPYDNRFELKQTVVGAYDPNDKTCLEGDTVLPEMAGAYVHYLIRFENTGNYPAENIVIIDNIDPESFDVSSLQPLHGSHPYTIYIENNEVQFRFENIQLAGMPSEDRHGYITFKIKLKPTLQLGDTFSNKASIYFDYNWPVITNDAITTLAIPLNNPGSSFKNNITLYPNPVKDYLNLAVGNNGIIDSAEIYNLAGQVILTHTLQGNKIDTSALSNGSYFIKVQTDKGSAYGRFVKQ